MSDSPPPVHAGEFNGPLDLLLDEVRRQNVAIENIELAPIAARFLEYVRSAAQRQLNLDIEWIHMAATLIQWKSRFLLASDPADKPAADPIREDLVRQLIEHRKQAADELGRRRLAEGARFSRATSTREGEAFGTQEPSESAFVSVWDLMREAREIARWMREHREVQHRSQQEFGIEPDDVSVSQMVQYLHRQISAMPGIHIDGLLLLESQSSASRRCCLFLGMLEMARDRRIGIEQSQCFGPLAISKACC